MTPGAGTQSDRPRTSPVLPLIDRVRSASGEPRIDADRVARLLDARASFEHAARSADLGFTPIASDADASVAPGPIVIAGLSNPWLFARAIEACGVCRDGYQPTLFVIEPDETACGSAFEVLSQASDSVPTENLPPIEVFTGPAAIDAFADRLRDTLDRQVPKIVVPGEADSALALQIEQTLGAAVDEQRREIARLRTEIAARSRGRDLAWWADRYLAALAGESDPLRVLIVSSRYSTFVRHAAARLGDAIEASGHHATVLLEPDDHSKLSALASIRQHRDFDPDLVVSINWPRPTLAAAWPEGVPSVCWIQDTMPHLFDEGIGKSLGPLDFMVGQVHGSLARDFGFPVTNRIFLPIPACEKTFLADAPVSRDPRFACDIAYISHQSEPVDAFIARTVAASSHAPDAVRVMEALAPRVLDAITGENLPVCPDLWTITVETIRSLSGGNLPAQSQIDRVYLGFVLPLAERAYRHATLRWAREIAERDGLSFRVFGRGWENHPDFADFARPPVEHGDDLRAAYASAGCHLHASLQTNAHQRIAECGLAGGVMLRRGPLPDRSIFQAECARELDASSGTVGLPDGRRITYADATGGRDACEWNTIDRLRTCFPDELRSSEAGLTGGVRVTIPSAFATLRPAWVSHQSMERHPDFGADPAGETRFDSREELASRVAAAIGDGAWRTRITARDRAWARRTNSFGSFWRRVFERIAERLAEQAGTDGDESEQFDGNRIAREWSPTLARNIGALRSRSALVADQLADRLTTHARRAVVRNAPPSRPPLPRGAIAELLDKQQPFAINGVGDGSCLEELIDRPTGLNGRRTAVYIIEPDLDRLIGTLSVVDLSQPDGPLAGGDIEWFVGPDWQANATERFLARSPLPLPRRGLGGGEIAQSAARFWNDLETRIQAEQREVNGRIAAWARSRDEAESFDALRGEADRPPRALVLTTRFSTVLKYSARSVCDALAELGWETELLTEAEDHHRLNVLSATRVVADLEPDVVLSINNHRDALPGLPERVPFVCWIQDDPVELTSEKAAAGIGPFDFATGIWTHRYIQQWNYPASACIPMPRLTAMTPPARPDADFSNIDLCYVSNAGADPESALAELTKQIDPNRPLSRVFLAVCAQLFERYAAGGSITETSEITRMLTDEAERQGVGPIPPAALSGQAELIGLKLNNPLYRQQGLGWAAEIAEESGLSLAVYGAGWDRNSRFARYARGSLPYGPTLASLMRSCAINLRLEPYPPTSHQRLLDALAADGVMISRSFGAWHQVENAFVLAYLDLRIGRFETGDDAVANLPAADADRLLRLASPLREQFSLDRNETVIDRYLYRERHGLLIDYQHAPLPPRYFETVFHDRDSMRTLIERFLADRSTRETLRATQGRFVRDRFGYRPNLESLMKSIGERLIERTAKREAPAA